MTPPVQEPSTQRKLGRFGLGIDQLLRRPAPTQTAGFVMEGAYMVRNVDLTVTTATTTNVTGYSTGGESIDSASIATNETTGQFVISAVGLYLVQLITVWATAFASPKMARLVVAGGNVVQDTQAFTTWTGEADTGLGTDLLNAEALFFVTSITTDVTVIASVRQESGINKDLDQCQMSCVRLSNVDLV